ncbi:hypothetical protein OG417_17825 [Actinoallomurus sp. NBC_01490]|uniref:hypothetical protein n=1 Tax=Actinoallomurus sp. NBC_01490 TaxID=2903557 RepID=UPI002E339432|nr:hypothetical protein [Actinoallomurus sp. NBC_01490]
MIAELVDRVLSGDDDAAWELEEATEDDLAVLRPHLVRLLDADVYLPERMFRAAGEDVQREAVARIDMGGTRNFQLFRVLAETRGPVVESAFVRWRKEPPPGIEAGVLASFLAGSGWDFDDDGRAREICGTTAYGLAPAGTTAPSSDRCPWCGGELWTALDVDTADPRVAGALAHTSWRGRLRIVTCFLCALHGTRYVEVTPDGGAAWSAYTGEPPDGRVLVAEPPPRVRLTPGEQLPDLHFAGGSALGGRPWWLQDPEYPACPACGKVMAYVGDVAPSDVLANDVAEGAIYLFLHTPCGLAAVVAQND